MKIDLDASNKLSTCRRCSEVIREEHQTNLRNVIMITCQQGKQLSAIINKIARINTHCVSEKYCKEKLPK
jgi:ribosomal protein S17E